MGRFRLRVLLALAGLACALTWTGCSSNSALSITLNPAAASTVTINQGQTQAISATVANDPNNAGVTWSLSGGGTLVNLTTTSVTYQAPPILQNNVTASITATSVTNTLITASVSITVNSVLTITTTSLPVGAKGVPYFGVINAGGSSGTFTWTQTSGTLPPGLVLTPSTTDSIVVSGTPTTLGTSKFTMQVTDSNGNTATQALSITINPPPPLSVATKTLSDGMVGANYSQTLQAFSGTPPFAWSITAGNLPLGLSLNGAVISGVPTTVGTSQFTVQVQDSSEPVQTATGDLSITINPSTSNNSNLKGNYAFLVSGFSPNGHFIAAGSFLADGAGSISNGVMDTNDPAGVQLGQAFTGTFAIGSSNVGTMNLGGRIFAVSIMANGNAKIIEFDDQTGTGTRNSGVLLKQTTSDFAQGQILGNYAFGFSGTDAAAARYALEGSMVADGAGHFSSGLLDSNDAGTAQNVGFIGTYGGINSATGRGTATISIAGQGTTSYSFYIVSRTQLLMMEVDFVSGVPSPIVSGSVLQQSGPFGGSSLSGPAVMETSAISGGLTQNQVGLFSGDGVVNFTINSDENTGGTLSTPTCTGTFSAVGVSSGRTTLSYSGTACAESVLYLVSPNQAFMIGTDAAVTFGLMKNQMGGPFTAASLSGAYAGGTFPPVLATAGAQVDNVGSDGVSTLNFTTNGSSSSGLSQTTSSENYAVASNGRGTMTPLSGGQPEIFYMVSPAEFISLFSIDPMATLEDFQQ